ncbi:hypothetical protein [Bremerella volcania]|uniref:hypothetical protein n=1 Tax=Bremerella volcania TaxID=2527984 RepID=UPI00119F4D92|nr:hypothetical protein [Bremerella volcania]
MYSPQWKRDDFVDAGKRFRDRWRLAGVDLGQELRGFFDLVEVDPEFKLPDSDIEELKSIPNGQHRIVARMDMRFRKCPKTRHLESPYAILLEIIEHGGSFSIEHGIIDIRDQSSVAVGGFMFRHA